MRIVAYCRVSTDHEEQLSSLSNQQEFFRQFAEKNGHELLKIYSDEGISGKAMNKRTQFLSMLSDAEKKQFDMIVVKDISRFARNTVDFLTAVRELKALGIEVQFLSINQTILGNSEFIPTVFSALAQEESANLSARIKFGKRQTAKKGAVPNYVYGYDRIDEFNLKINEEQAKLVRRIYFEYTQIGFGLRKIGIRLNNDGVKSPKGECRWNAKTIKRILSNPIYKGVLVSRKSVGEDFISGARRALEPEEEFTFRKDEYRIIDVECFEKAGKILLKRAEQYADKNPHNRESTRYTFSTLIKCPLCGYSFTRRLSGNSAEKYAYWKCSGNNSRGMGFCRNTAKIKNDDLADIIKEYFMSQIKNPQKIEDAVNEAATNEADAKKARDNIKRLGAKKEKYMDMYINDIITLEQLKNKTAPINEKISALSAMGEGRKLTEAPKPLTLSTHIDKMLKNDALSNAELKKIIENITISNDGIIINFKKRA